MPRTTCHAAVSQHYFQPPSSLAGARPASSRTPPCSRAASRAPGPTAGSGPASGNKRLGRGSAPGQRHGAGQNSCANSFPYRRGHPNCTFTAGLGGCTNRNNPTDPAPASARARGAAERSQPAPVGEVQAALSPSPYKEWNHVQQQIVTFKALIGSLSNLALITHTHTHKYKNLQSSVPRAKITIFFFNAI